MIDDIPSRIAEEIDKQLKEAFSLYELDIEQIKQLVESGRLVCFQGGNPQEIIYRAILDGMDLFCLRIKIEIDMQTQKLTVSSDFMPINEKQEGA